jgi:hypothetical protein
MTPQILIKQWTGLIVGILIIAITYLLLKVIPYSVSGIILFFGASLIAGYLTPGPVKKGAIAGLGCGLAAMGGMLVLSAGDPGILTLVVVFSAIMFLPPNTIGGIIGNILRNGVTKSLFVPKSDEDKILLRNQLAGIILGAIISVVPVFFMGSLSLLLLVPPFAGGVISGIFSPGGLTAGFYSGLGTAVVAIVTVTSIILVPSSQASDPFVAGLGGIVIVGFAIFAFPSAIAGGIIGALIKGTSKKNPYLN